MISTLLTKIIGSRNDRTLKALRKIVKQINAMEPQFEALSDAQLQAKTVEYRQRLEQGETLEQLLPEALPPCVKPLAGCSACVTSTSS